MFFSFFFILFTPTFWQVQGFIYGILSILALLAHNCQLSMRQYKISYLMYIIYFRGNYCIHLFLLLFWLYQWHFQPKQKFSRTPDWRVIYQHLYFCRSKMRSSELEYCRWHTATIRTNMASRHIGSISHQYFGSRLPSTELHLDSYVVNANWWVRRQHVIHTWHTHMTTRITMKLIQILMHGVDSF